jgi:hypothetical protein
MKLNNLLGILLILSVFLNLSQCKIERKKQFGAAGQIKEIGGFDFEFQL